MCLASATVTGSAWRVDPRLVRAQVHPPLRLPPAGAVRSRPFVSDGPLRRGSFALGTGRSPRSSKAACALQLEVEAPGHWQLEPRLPRVSRAQIADGNRGLSDGGLGASPASPAKRELGWEGTGERPQFPPSSIPGKSRTPSDGDGAHRDSERPRPRANQGRSPPGTSPIAGAQRSRT
jgi:hypothetical protein